MLLISKKEAKTAHRDPEALCERLALGGFIHSALLEFDSAQDDTEVWKIVCCSRRRPVLLIDKITYFVL